MSRPASEDYLIRKKDKKGNYLPNFILRLQYSPFQRAAYRQLKGVELPPVYLKPTHTSDRTEARRLTWKYVAMHLEVLMLAKCCRDKKTDWGQIVEGGAAFPDGYDVTRADGIRLRVQGGKVFPKGPDGTFLTDDPLPVPQILGELVWNDYAKQQPEYLAMVEHRKRRDTGGKDYNTAIIDRYIQIEHKDKEEEQLLRKALVDWQAANGNKTFAAATRDDARKFIDYIRAGYPSKGVSAGRAERIVSALRSAVNSELLENRLKTKIKENIFLKQKIRMRSGEILHSKAAFNDEHLAKIKAHRNVFSDDEWLMIVMHISTGIRPEGLFSIEFGFFEEFEDEAGKTSRVFSFYITKDKDKKDAIQLYGPRALPFPKAVLEATKLDGWPLLPTEINRRLFTTGKTLKSFLQGINYKLRKIGVNSIQDKIVLYSGRHRADQRLETRAPSAHILAIYGHTRKLDSIRKESNPRLMYGRREYGHKFTMAELKPSIDLIGF